MRRRIRFSLRTLMLLTLFAACGMLALSRQEPWPLFMTIPSVEEDEGFADFQFSPNSASLLVWSQNYIQVWDLASKTCVLKQTIPQTMTDCKWVGNERIVYTSMDERLRILNVAKATTLELPKRAEPRPFQELDANVDGTRVVRFAGGRAGAELWDPKSTLLRKEILDARFSGFSNDGMHFLSRKGEDTLQIHDSMDGRVLATWQKPKRVLLQEGWDWESGVIRATEVEYIDAGSHIQPDGTEFKVTEQHFWNLALTWRDGVLKESHRDFNVAVHGESPAYDVSVRRVRRGIASDGRDIRDTKVITGNGVNHTLPDNPLESGFSPIDRGDFSPDCTFVACVRQTQKNEVRVRVWNNRRPEAWWGMAWIPECWTAIALVVAALFSFYFDRKSQTRASTHTSSAPLIESSASAVRTSPAKAI